MRRLALIAKGILLFCATPIILGAILFIPAGTLNYWQAWLYLAVLIIPFFFVALYFIVTDPAFLERRLKMREKEARQKLLIKLSYPIFIAGFLIPGLDQRFGWSSVPSELVLAADALVFLGYLLVFFVFRENSYAGRTIRVEKGQKVISTGPYAVVRHPMYVGVLLMYLSTPIALGSYWAVIPFLFMIPVIVFRIFNEEEVLRRELPGYKAYCKKVRHRLIPYIW